MPLPCPKRVYCYKYVVHSVNRRFMRPRVSADSCSCSISLHCHDFRHTELNSVSCFILQHHHIRNCECFFFMRAFHAQPNVTWQDSPELWCPPTCRTGFGEVSHYLASRSGSLQPAHVRRVSSTTNSLTLVWLLCLHRCVSFFYFGS